MLNLRQALAHFRLVVEECLEFLFGVVLSLDTRSGMGDGHIVELGRLAVGYLVASGLDERRRFVGQAGRAEGLGWHGRSADGSEVQDLVLVHVGMRFSMRGPACGCEVIDLPAWVSLRALEDHNMVLSKVLRIAGLL